MTTTRKLTFAIALIMGLLALHALPALAQTPTPNEINEIARGLWCPLCNGVRLDNCELQACIQMKEVIAQKLEAGESEEHIKAYFLEQYGDVVLGAPSTQGFNRLAWILPILAAAVGLGWLVYFVRSVTRKRAAVADTASMSQTLPGDAAQDEYLRRVDEEIRNYR
jgi:cytochrome c-type biogenesis protein CcmH